VISGIWGKKSYIGAEGVLKERGSAGIACLGTASELKKNLLGGGPTLAVNKWGYFRSLQRRKREGRHDVQYA